MNEHNYQAVSISVAVKEDHILKECGCLSLQTEKKTVFLLKRGVWKGRPPASKTQPGKEQGLDFILTIFVVS